MTAEFYPFSSVFVRHLRKKGKKKLNTKLIWLQLHLALTLKQYVFFIWSYDRLFATSEKVYSDLVWNKTQSH